jgi:hypothetical protein
MPRGGKRPGSGAKKGSEHCNTVEKNVYRQKARDLIGPHMADVITAHIANAKGIKYLVVREKSSGKFLRVGEIAAAASEEVIEVWEKDPSIEAAKVLLDRLLDKPSEHVELTGADGAPLEVRWKD